MARRPPVAADPRTETIAGGDSGRSVDQHEGPGTPEVTCSRTCACHSVSRLPAAVNVNARARATWRGCGARWPRRAGSVDQAVRLVDLRRIGNQSLILLLWIDLTRQPGWQGVDQEAGAQVCKACREAAGGVLRLLGRRSSCDDWPRVQAGFGEHQADPRLGISSANRRGNGRCATPAGQE